MAKTPASPLPRAAVVYHPRKTNLAALRDAVDRHESQAGWAPTLWHATEAEDAGAGATRRALDEGASVVLASGGDGTVRAVAEVLRGTGVPLAVVPQGTGNLLARNIGMQLGDLDEAARAAFRGVNRPIDLGVITIIRPGDAGAGGTASDEAAFDEAAAGAVSAAETETEHVFLVLAGMGLDARTITATSSKLKKWVGWLAYVDAGVRTMATQSPLRIHYSVDGRPAKPLTVFTVMIGNCGLMPGGVLLIPDAQLDDGLLDVVALRPLGPFSWLRIWHKIGWENGVLRRTKAGRRMIDLVNDTRSVTYLRTGRFALSVDHPESIQLDGEDFGLALAASGRVDPGALVLRVLPGWTRAV
ncbi:MAG: diacylglycerol kinase family protein [Leucobacter sp.]